MQRMHLPLPCPQQGPAFSYLQHPPRFLLLHWQACPAPPFLQGVLRAQNARQLVQVASLAFEHSPAFRQPLSRAVNSDDQPPKQTETLSATVQAMAEMTRPHHDVLICHVHRDSARLERTKAAL